MGLRYRKQIKVTDNVKLNVSKSGVSTSFGGPGHTVNLSKRGTRVTVGIPGTGISYSKMAPRKKKPETSKEEMQRLRKKAQEDFGFSNREMRILEKMVKKYPKRMKQLSKQEIIADVKHTEKQHNLMIIVLIGFLLICVVSSLIKG